MRKDDQAHILVAEDEEHILGTIDFILKREGFSVSTAANGREAKEIILTAKDSSLNPNYLVMPIIDDPDPPAIEGTPVLAKIINSTYSITLNLDEDVFANNDGTGPLLLSDFDLLFVDNSL